jgi:hypothetical protein
VVGVLRDDYQLLFPSQIEWIQALLQFVSRRDDLFLVVRVHPREFPNRREAVKSEHAKLLAQTFTALPPNAVVNWPTDGISMYDLANEAAVILNAWSTVGKEMSLLGLPVVIYSPDLLFYPADLNHVATTLDDYFNKIETALHEAWNVEWLRKTYRWLALEYGHSLIDISDGYSQKETAVGSLLHRALGKAQRMISPYHQEKSDCLSRPSRLKAAQVFAKVIEQKAGSLLDVGHDVPTISLDDETRSLRMEVRRLLQVLYPPHRTGRSGALHLKLQRFADGLEG